ncbi:MAG: DUF881 domain-containing protein [Nocardioides sp.]
MSTQGSTPTPDPTPGAGRDRGHRQKLGERLSFALASRVRSARTRSWGWRTAAPAMFVVAGALFVTSAVSSGGTDLRAGRYDDLPGLAEAEADRVEGLRQRQSELVQEVDDLTERLGDTDAEWAQAEADAVAGPAGLVPVRGPGMTVTLTDAPEAVVNTVGSGVNINNLVVHQQDIQAVVNALWAGGAEAMTVQGQRVVSTTGIRCVGNTVILHGVPYAPPYVISAIGPGEGMLDSLDQSPYIGFYLEAVAAYQVGWDVRVETEIVAPAFSGSTELNYARPVADP